MSKETMSSRERVRAALRGNDVDRIPWSPLIDGYFLGKVNPIEGFRRIGADAMLRHVINFIGSAPFIIGAAPPGKTIPWTARKTQVGNENEVIFETPVGTLTERFRFNPESPNIPWTTKRRIQNIEDAKIFAWMCERAEFAPLPGYFEFVEKQIGDDGITTVSVLGTPINWLINSEVDVDTFWYLYFDHTSELEAVFEAQHQMNRRMLTACAEGPGEVVIQYENLSSTLISPKIWDKYCVRWINEYADILHAGGKMYLQHNCGHLLAFGDRLGKVKLDGIVDVATPPTGTLPDLGAARKLWGPVKFIMGGIDPVALAEKNPEEMMEFTRNVMKKMGDGRRMALGSTDAVPKNTTWEKLQAVTKVVKEEGSFPLNR